MFSETFSPSYDFFPAESRAFHHENFDRGAFIIGEMPIDFPEGSAITTIDFLEERSTA
jgi:hypothetical protein